MKVTKLKDQTNIFITDKLYISFFKNLRRDFNIWVTNYLTMGLQIGTRAVELNYYSE